MYVILKQSPNNPQTPHLICLLEGWMVVIVKLRTFVTPKQHQTALGSWEDTRTMRGKGDWPERAQTAGAVSCGRTGGSPSAAASDASGAGSSPAAWQASEWQCVQLPAQHLHFSGSDVQVIVITLRCCWDGLQHCKPHGKVSTAACHFSLEKYSVELEDISSAVDAKISPRNAYNNC